MERNHQLGVFGCWEWEGSIGSAGSGKGTLNCQTSVPPLGSFFGSFSLAASFLFWFPDNTTVDTFVVIVPSTTKITTRCKSKWLVTVRTR